MGDMEKWVDEYRTQLKRREDSFLNDATERSKGAWIAYRCAIGMLDRLRPKEQAHPAPPAESLHDAAKRMCDTFPDCDGCPCDLVFSHCVVGVQGVLTDDEADAQIAALRRWQAENPPKAAKTYREDFFEKFPEAVGYHARLDDLTFYPYPKVGAIYRICSEKVEEFAKLQNADAWDKPLGYWEAP
jgi:hypothetical protein